MYLSKVYFAKCTRLACLLSFASLFSSFSPEIDLNFLHTGPVIMSSNKGEQVSVDSLPLQRGATVRYRDTEEMDHFCIHN